MLPLNEWKVIVVDDDKDSRTLLSAILSLHGIQVFVAENGIEFRKLWRTFIPTLVIMDLAMPSPDGWTLINESLPTLRQRHTPIVAVTAYHSDRVREEALKAGFTAVIGKPIRATTFIELLKKIVADSSPPSSC